MRPKLILLALVLLASTAMAAEVAVVARNGNDTIRLWNSPCVHAGTLALIKPDMREKFRKARAMLNGRDWFACWVVDGENAFILYEDGDQALVPLTQFKIDEGA